MICIESSDIVIIGAISSGAAINILQGLSFGTANSGPVPCDGGKFVEHVVQTPSLLRCCISQWTESHVDATILGSYY